MNETITNKNYKKLVIKIGTWGLSFCRTDLLQNNVDAVVSINFEQGVPLEDELWKVFVHYPELKLQYDSIMVLHDNSFNTFVPDALFDENFAASYLQYNTPVFETDFFTHDDISHYQIKNIYVPLVNINNYLLEKLGSFEYKNANTILVSKLLETSKNTTEKNVYVHIQNNHFEIVIVRNQKLLFYNSFTYNTPEDFLYYLLFTLEQLELNPETVSVLLLGKTDTENLCYKLGYEYIRNIDFYNPPAIGGLDIEQTREHFILINA